MATKLPASIRDRLGRNGRGVEVENEPEIEDPERRDGFAVAVDQRPEAPPPDPEAIKRRFSLKTFESLSLPSYRWFFLSMFGWFASMNMQMLVRGYIVFDLTGSYAALGLVSLANAIPGMVLSLPGGLLADKLPKKHVLQVGQAANMSVSVVLAALMLAGMLEFWHLLACAVLQGGINALIMPARQSMIPDIVPAERLMNAVALSTAAMNVMRLAAPALGGVLLAAFGPGWVYLTMAGLYGSSAFFLMPVRRLAPEAVKAEAPGQTRGRGASGGLSDIMEGCRYIWRDQTVLSILMINLLIVLFSMPFQMMLPGFVKEVLDAGPDRLGVLMSITGVGALGGSLVIASLPARNRGMILLLSSLVLGVSLVVFTLSTWFWLTAIVMIAIGIGQSGRMSMSNVLLQSYTQPDYRGRVMSVYMLEFSLVSFGVFIVGLIASVVGIQAAIGGTAVALVVLVLFTLAFVPRVRNLK